MNTAVRKKINNKFEEEVLLEWTYWGKWDPNLLTVSLWHQATTSKTLKYMRVILRGEMRCLDGSYYFLKSDFEILHSTLEKDGVEWFDKFLKICQEETNVLINFEGNFEELLDQLSNHFLGCIMLITFVDPWFENKIRKICANENVSSERVLQMMQPEQKTPLMEYQEELRKLNQEDIDAFLSKWAWVGTHAFGGQQLTRESLQESIDGGDFSKNGNPIDSQLANPNSIRSKELEEMIHIGKYLAFHRSAMVEQMNKVIFKYRKTMLALAKENEISYEKLINLTHEEILKLSRHQDRSFLLDKREARFGFISEEGGKRLIFGEELDKEVNLYSTLNVSNDKKKEIEVQGTVASKSVVQGIAKIVLNARDCEKIGLGDILIAPETTPDYIHAMQKAAAFVTDQGGITSHAAITAREMKKPCITGTKNATKLFVDGDFVEVDAINGIVKKIRK